jgi:hypothetical protein
MSHSDATDQIAAALAKAQGEIKNPRKSKTVTVRTKTGGSYEFSYADLTDITDSVKKPLSDNGIAYTQHVEEVDNRNRLVTTLWHSSGQWIRAINPLFVSEQSNQAFGSAVTYMKRYALAAMTGVSADDDDDANRADGNQMIVPPETKPTKAVIEVDPNITNVSPAAPEIAKSTPDWIAAGKSVIDACRSEPDQIDTILEDPMVDAMRNDKKAEKVYQRMMAAVDKLRTKIPVAPTIEDDPEKYLKWLKKKVEEFNLATELALFQKYEIPAISKGFPPDQAAAKEIMTRRMTELASSD